MPRLNYYIDDSAIVELLGRQNFTTKESAILELVKNAYDAKANNFTIEFKYDNHGALYLICRDDGDGMNEEDILNKWMRVGKSQRGYEFEDLKGEKRVYAGSKGIGRFALARLGSYVELLSKQIDNSGVVWKTDWTASEYEIDKNLTTKGTTFIVRNLRDKWDIQNYTKLKDFLSRTVFTNKIKINVIYENESSIPQNVFADVRLGINYTSEITFNYDERTLSIDVLSDEFENTVVKVVPNINITRFSKQIDVFDFFINKNEMTEFQIEDYKLHLSNVGKFNGKLFFGISRHTEDDINKYFFKHPSLQNEKDGVILYRNDFSISSYEGYKDWLGINQRARRSPAAASHPTGDWKVRSNQLFGYILIDKENNKELRELSNRQGIEENAYYDTFLNIIKLVIGEFEAYRQGIIREIRRKNDPFVNKKIPDYIQLVRKNYKVLSQMDESELKLFSSQINEALIRSQDIRYDVQILNMLATIGLKASAIAHDLNNEKNFLSTYYKNIIDVLQEEGFWEKLDSEEFKKQSRKDVPLQLMKSNEISTKIIKFIEVMLSNIEKRMFQKQRISLCESLNQIVKQWQYDYSWIKIDTSECDSIELNISQDAIVTIFDNLILNSVQQNDDRGDLEIKISAKLINGKIHMVYRDNGVGLIKKYLDDPYKILKVHETSRKDGHGLGMWMVNNTLHQYDGEVDYIDGKNGFEIKFNFDGGYNEI